MRCRSRCTVSSYRILHWCNYGRWYWWWGSPGASCSWQTLRCSAWWPSRVQNPRASCILTGIFDSTIQDAQIQSSIVTHGQTILYERWHGQTILYPRWQPLAFHFVLSTGLQYGEWYRRPTLREFARLKLQTSWPSPRLVAKGTLHTTMVKGGSYTPVSISVVMAPWHSLVYEKIVFKLEVWIQFRTSVIRRCEDGWVASDFSKEIY